MAYQKRISLGWEITLHHNGNWYIIGWYFAVSTGPKGNKYKKDTAYTYSKSQGFKKILHHEGTWWRHQMETFSALLAGEYSSQRPVTRSFDVFFDLRMNKRSSKQSRRRWFVTPMFCSLWRHCKEVVMSIICGKLLHTNQLGLNEGHGKVITSTQIYGI